MPFTGPGMTSRLIRDRIGAELPISRLISTQATAAFMSSGWDSEFSSIWMLLNGSEPVRRIRPLLFGRATLPSSVHEAVGGLNLADISGLVTGISTWQAWMSGEFRPG